jgi:hypothetical protein
MTTEGSEEIENGPGPPTFLENNNMGVNLKFDT